jgi:hypothetical protein
MSSISAYCGIRIVVIRISPTIAQPLLELLHNEFPERPVVMVT